MSYGFDSHRNEGQIGEEVQNIKEDIKELKHMMKAIMGHLKINLSNDREERSKSPTRKKSSFSRWVERDLA